MKTPITLILFFIFSSSTVCAQEYLFPSYSDQITVDGDVQAMEWQSRTRVPVVRGSDATFFSLAFDSSKLYVLAQYNLGSMNHFPEILIDGNNSKSSSWESMDDFWFHVSATDCHSDSTADDYSLCDTLHSTWAGEPNWGVGPVPNEVEFEIGPSISKPTACPVRWNQKSIA